jgi:hypothetical protein
MTRLLAAVTLLAITAVPAFACEWNQSANTTTPPQTVASQPADTTTQPPPATDHSPS